MLSDRAILAINLIPKTSRKRVVGTHIPSALRKPIEELEQQHQTWWPHNETQKASP